MFRGAALTGNNTRTPLKQRKNDTHQTAPEAVITLLKYETLPPVVWEPACGPGAIVWVLRQAGHQVYASDLVDYHSPDQDMAGWDFLLERQLPLGVEMIITNPPFKNAAAFAAHALRLCPRVAMLMRLNFLEAGTAKTRAGRERLFCLDQIKPARVYVFRNRLPMMSRLDWVGDEAASAMPCAWFVWDAAHHGPTELVRVSWEKEASS